MLIFRAPQRKTFPIADIKVLKRCYDPHTDSYLVVGKVAQKNKNTNKTMKQFVIGWQSRHKKKLIDCRYFIDEPAAMAEFKTLSLRHNRPSHKNLQTDWQQQKVYDWEDDMLVPHAKILTQQETLDIIKKISKAYGVSEPRLVWQTPIRSQNGQIKPESCYDDSNHTIYFQHRDIISLLHEIAHVILTDQLDEDLDAFHSPAFVWKAIELYHQYGGLNLDYLILTAHKFGLLGDIDEEQIINPNRKGHNGPKNNPGPKP